MEWLSKLAIALVAAYVVVGGLLFAMQRQILFRPSGEAMDPRVAGLGVGETVTIQTPDGEQLHGWFVPSNPGQTAVLHLHGNGATLANRIENYREIIDSNFALLALSYRGYPGSTGSPSERGLITDGLAAYDWLSERFSNVVIFGESLGAAVALAIATEREPSALVLEAPFSAVVDMAAARYPFLPVNWLVRDPFLSRERIANVMAPVLIFGAGRDQVVPGEHAKVLFELAREPKRLVFMDEADHFDLWERGIWPETLTFLRDKQVLVSE